MHRTIPKLHVITPPGVAERDLATTHALLAAGAPLVQVRTKAVDDRVRLEAARTVLCAARAADSTCLVNDRVDIAMAAGADGVHVGADDLPAAIARHLLGPGAIVGATCRSADDARRAEASGASYLGVGPVYATSTKAGLPEPMGPRGVEAAAAAVDLPVIAISGITVDNAAEVLDAGAWGVAVVGGVYGAHDPVASLQELMELTGCGDRRGPARGLMIDAHINGEAVRVPEGTHLRALVIQRVEHVEGVAVACNDALVPRSEWPATYVRDGDRIELLVAAQGG